MFIKQVIIQGFRSYRDQTIIEPFSPQHNVIVGRNGSGKSNFFFAIQFVLSDEFSNLRPEERQALLHEGTGPRVVSAFVEIIFDNSDNRIPIDKEEVSIRRVIGSKKDQYFLDKKNVTKSDIMNLLEGAGFSRSNPYYIVKQGKITQLATAKDQERLKLLREVAGTKVYDERKEESRSILEESEGKKKKIEELLKYIEERLSTLEDEKEELKAYQELDKERRCLEYTIHDKELKETRADLEKLDNKRLEESSAASKSHKTAADAGDRVEELSQRLRVMKEKMSSLKSEKQQLDEERQEQIKQRAKLELDIKDLEDNVKEDSSSKENCKKELGKLEKTIESKECELAKLLPEYERLKKAEEEYTSRLKGCEQRRSELYAKQGRTSQFTSKEERDKWIKKEIKSLSNSISKKESQIRAVQDDVQHLRQGISRLAVEIKERNDDLENRRLQIEKENKSNGEAKKKRDESTNRRKELWRKEAALEQSLQNTREELNKFKKNLRITISKAISNGIESVKKIVSDKGIEGVYGTLIENFECPEKFFTCVELTAGNKLFHMLVDTDKTASNILTTMNKHKMAGEVTFMPLNKLKARGSSYPETADAHPMIGKLKFDETYRQAMELVFGRTLICRNMDVCSQFAKSEGLDCITLDGDQVNNRGALTGGYYDSRKSRMDIQKHIWLNEAKLNEEQEALDELKKEVEETDALVTQVLAELQKTETRKVQLKETYEKQRLDVRSRTQEKNNYEQNLAPKEHSLIALEADLQGMRGTLESMKSELGTELLSQLNIQDQKEVDQLNIEIQNLQENMRDTLRDRSQLEGEKNTLENLLSKNLIRKRDGLLQQLEEISVEDRGQQLEAHTMDFESLNRTINQTKARLSEMKEEIDELTKQAKKTQTELDKSKSEERASLESINEEAKLMEKNANKRSLLVKKKEECMKKIRELGSLPADAFEKYQGADVKLKPLWRKLKKCNEELKKYSHVNKKALDQYISFSDQKEKLMKRKDELDKGYQAIIELMDVLEQRKHEAILFTFKQVSFHFSDVFKHLVPKGKASLVMKTDKLDQKDDTEETDSQGTSSQKAMPPVDEFTGVSIKVSFSGKSAETREMNQLSGGQKSLVALGLIFAIQRCDPAPFYLFDEIDQALDPQYRSSVADMIRTQSEKAQFITTTFRPELLEAADKFYGVKFRNKVSHIDAISKDQAKDFVEDDRQNK